MENVDMVSNPNQRTLCVLVLDASGSMDTGTSNGKSRIDTLNDGIELLCKELKEDPVAKDRVVLSIVAVGGPVGGANVLLDWTDIKEFDPFRISSGGTTPLGAGMLLALDLISQGKESLKSSGIGYLRPWVMVITDGEPTDSEQVWKDAIKEVRDAESRNKCLIFPIAVDGCNTSRLSELTTSPIKQMSSVKFNELFQWLSSSLSAASSSAPGATVQLPSTDPWAGVRL